MPRLLGRTIWEWAFVSWAVLVYVLFFRQLSDLGAALASYVLRAGTRLF